jgi:3-methyladenine DNA glycosylase/8-oxoguanine DNA glycosylase
MKVTIDLDLTPEEARRALGLPDLTPLHDRYLQLMMGMMDGSAIKPEMLETLMKSWSPMGEAGMAMWRRLLEGGARKPD